MRIGFITDCHNNPATKRFMEAAVDRYDFLGVGGDIGSEIMNDVVNITKEHDNVFVVMGNHDLPLSYGCSRILHGSKVRFKGYTIGGLGGSLPIGGWEFECDDTEYLVITKNMELTPKVDILISHEPAYNTPVDLTYQKIHAGSAAIAKYVEETQMPLVLSGHIHEASGFGKIGKTLLANPGPLAEGRYLEVDISGKTITRAKIFYDKKLEWLQWRDLLAQSIQKRRSFIDTIA